MRVALVRVLALLQCDRPGRLTLERDARLLVQSGADQMKVVDRGLVLDLDLVLPGLDRLEVLAALLDFNLEAGPDLALAWRRCASRGNDDQGRGDGGGGKCGNE